MSNPIDALKRLPWLVLLQAALLTTLVAIAAEFVIVFSARFIPMLQALFSALLAGPLAILTSLAIAVGLGALAVVMLEKLGRSHISTGSLWGLLPCLLLWVVLANTLGLLPLGVISLNEVQALGLVIGIFWKGRPYWQSFKRW